MTPLGASLIFVFISVLVSLFRHLFFHSSSLNPSDDSNISLTKLHTLTIAQMNPPKKAYNSLYEAYFKIQSPNTVQPHLPYNSYALKKAILNNEGVYLCDQKFAAIFQERTICDGLQSNCKWKTLITVFRLPLLKKQESKIVEVQGKILMNGNANELQCNKKQIRNWQAHYQLNFVILLNTKDSKKGLGWSMHSLIIEEYMKKDTMQFSLKLLKLNLKNVNHYPMFYSFDQKCLSYITEEEPWLVHYNCADSWNSFNILHPQLQKEVLNSVNFTLSLPTFPTTQQVRPLFLHLFRSNFTAYIRQNCPGPICPRQELKYDKNFITYVFQITNSPHRFGKIIIQITIGLNDQNEDERKLISYKVLSNDIHPQRKVHVDCKVNTREFKLIKGLYTYQLGISDDYIVGSLQKHSLMCICAYNYNQNLKVIEIDDLLGNFNITDLPHELILRSKELIQQKIIQNRINKRESMFRKKEDQPQEQGGWFDFELFNFRYDYQQNAEKDLLPQDQIQQIDIKQNLPNTVVQVDKKDKKNKSKGKKRNKKGNRKQQRRDDNKDLIKFPDDPVNQKLQQLTQMFSDLGYNNPFQSQAKIIVFPMPFVLTSESKFQIVNGELQYPLIYIETVKKYLLTYHLKEQDEEHQNGSNNQTFKPIYSYKYSQIGVDLKTPDHYIGPFPNETNQPKNIKRKQYDQIDLDRFLLQVVQHNGEILNNVKSIAVVDSKYDGSLLQYQLHGLKKPNRKQVIVAWGWGLQVYEVNWDKKGLKNQLIDIQEQLNSKPQGIQMAALLPFIQLFATVYCLFQSLVTSR